MNQQTFLCVSHSLLLLICLSKSNKIEYIFKRRSFGLHGRESRCSVPASRAAPGLHGSTPCWESLCSPLPGSSNSRSDFLLPHGSCALQYCLPRRPCQRLEITAETAYDKTTLMTKQLHSVLKYMLFLKETHTIGWKQWGFGSSPHLESRVCSLFAPGYLSLSFPKQ